MFCLSLLPLVAVETRNLGAVRMADFEKGTLTQALASSEGRLTPAPVVKEIYDPSVTFLWSHRARFQGQPLSRAAAAWAARKPN